MAWKDFKQIVQEVVASKTDAGVVKVGNNLTVNSGTIDVNVASNSTLGVMKSGDGLKSTNGTVSVNTGNGLTITDGTLSEDIITYASDIGSVDPNASDKVTTPMYIDDTDTYKNNMAAGIFFRVSK